MMSQRAHGVVAEGEEPIARPVVKSKSKYTKCMRRVRKRSMWTSKKKNKKTNKENIFLPRVNGITQLIPHIIFQQ